MPEPTPTLAQALRQAQQAGLERIDAQLLLLHLLGAQQPRLVVGARRSSCSPPRKRNSTPPCAPSAWMRCRWLT